MRRTIDYFEGCILGGAIGDALGWPVEFLKYDSIVNKYGSNGIIDLVCNDVGKSEITDDTQMTVFTAEGLLRAECKRNRTNVSDELTEVFYAYHRWLTTQGNPEREEFKGIYNGWLLKVKALHEKRAPGNTCLASLLSGEFGTIDSPINNSKGCGGVMRVAPVGLFYSKNEAFDKACSFAALTHDHPSGYLSAGVHANIIACIIDGYDLEAAVNDSLLKLMNYSNHEECSSLIKKAIELSQDKMDPLNAINLIGQGWVGDEAIAIAVYCALKYKNDFRKALITAVNHDGDSDSTGAITGNILGAFHGINKIPTQWIEKLELSIELIQITNDLFNKYEASEEWLNRYPIA